MIWLARNDVKYRALCEKHSESWRFSRLFSNGTEQGVLEHTEFRALRPTDPSSEQPMAAPLALRDAGAVSTQNPPVFDVGAVSYTC